MRRELENSILKAKIQIKQIGGLEHKFNDYVSHFLSKL